MKTITLEHKLSYSKKKYEDEKELLFGNNNTDLTFLQHVVESPSLPLLIPMMHLPETAGKHSKRKSYADLLDNTWALQGGMRYLMCRHLEEMKLEKCRTLK